MNLSMPERRYTNGTLGFSLQILFVLLLLSVLTGQAFAANCTASYTYTSNGGSSNYNLNAGQSLKLTSGTYTGTLDNFASNATVCVESGATFQPNNMNNVAGTLVNYGTTKLGTFSYNSGTVIDNYGTLNFTGGLNTNGATTFYNRANATMTMANSFQLGNNSTFINDGLVSAAQDFNAQQGTTLTNNYRLEAKGNFNPDGIFTNNGRVYAEKFINMNSNLNVTNNCLLVSFDGFNTNNPNVTNNGTILVTKPGSKWQHNAPGIFHNGANAKVAGHDFTNSSTITGSGAFIFSGSTTNQGTFAGNSSTDTINFYDETQAGSQIFDFQNTTPTNTVRTAIPRPTELDAPHACTSPYKSFSQGCPINSFVMNQTGNATSATTSGNVQYSNQAVGALSNAASTGSSTNAALVRASGVLNLDLGTIIPANSPLIISLAPDTDTARIRIETSLNGSTYTSAGTFGASSTLGTSAALAKLTRITLNVPAGGIRYVRFVSENTRSWVDGVEYSQFCQIVSYDYGDAPAAYGNPSHVITDNLSIGDNVDVDSGTQQNANADADDTNGSPDDEDGLQNPAILPTTAGQNYTLTTYVKNETGSTAYLTAYIDFNRDGDFSDPGERADTQHVYWNGSFHSTFTVPAGMTAGTTYARLRLSQTKAEAESPIDAATSGEVEDHKLTISSGPFYDFGDAPASYGNPRHTIVNSIFLGTNRPDSETGSQHSYNASGDGVDEDGAPKQYGNANITLFPILKMTATSYSVDIKTTNTTGAAGKLYGWIDFDKNGAFDADEAASVNVANNTNGTVTLTWNSIPTDIKLGTTFIRLRLTTDSAVSTSTPANNANDGEVEDFPIAVAIDVPPDSPDVTIVRGEDQTCSSTIFTDNFDDLASEQYFGANTSATPFVIRNWTATGGGSDTYARTVEVAPFAATQGRSIYFGNGMMRRYYPHTGGVLVFDGNGRMLEPPDAVELRDDPDDVTPGVNTHDSDWGPEPVTLSRTFASTAGQRYRLYFSAIPEGGEWNSGMMRVDTPSGSVHFKAPGKDEGIQKYRIEFTATGASSTIRFVNYGHIGTDGGWCDPNSVVSGAWCTVGGFPVDKKGNELIIDDVAVALASACPSSGIAGSVYTDSNGNNTFDTGTESGLANITVTLYDNNGTPTNANDDNLITSTSSNASGAYSFTNISPALRYRVEVDARDTDLPASAFIGTANPLADVSVAAGSTLSNQNFGFDLGCNASAGQFGGIAFRDYNQNGIRESQEEGIAGITVTAYNSANAVAATATTDARGWYTLSGLSNGTQYRLEYTNLPTGLSSGAVGVDNASTVRFVTASGSCTTHLGLSDPIEYCEVDPSVAAFNFVNGDPSVADVGNYASLFTFPYNATGDAYNQTPAPVTKANTSQTGALWGMAYQKTTRTLFASAAMRRFAGFGTLGTGGIYKVDMTDPNAAYTGATPYVDLRTIGIDTGNDVRIAGDSCNNLASGPWSPSRDVAAWDKVGKVGVGDIDYDERNNRLWLVNLNDRKLYGINNVSPTTTPTAGNVLGGYAINLPSPYTCASGTFRPWAVKYHRGYVYVGGVCDAASDPYNLSKVRGYVLRFDPANTAAGFSHVKDFAINQPRQGFGYSNISEWSGWLPQADAVNVRPQFHSPIIGNLEFDTDGSIIVGIIDRAGLQKGTNAYDEPVCADPTIDYADTMGDVLRLCKTDTGYLNDGDLGCTTTIPSNSKTTDEYYWGDLGPSNNAWEGMNDIAAGGLALAPGKEHVLASAYDANSWGTNGVVWLNNRTGAKDNAYSLSWTTLGKSTGMGELEVLCDPAPIEVGNRVWLDTDKDGIQDAEEAGINNVNVTLTCGSDSATTTTNTNGEYYFSNAPGKNAIFMGSGESCSLSVANAQASLGGYTVTTQNADGKTDNNSQTDIRDSDATVNGGNAVINFTVGSGGQNNHGLDFGYKSTSSPGTVSGTVYLDANKNAAFDAGETALANITVSLYNENGTAGDLSDDTLVNTATTNASGAYSFTNVDASRTYRAAADTTDPDLPANTSSTTTNPLTAITVTAGGTTANKNFGFGQVVAACSPPSPTTTGINASITWNHNPFTPASETTGGHPVPAILNTGLIASAANEVRSNLTTGATDWEMYAETASVPATLAEAINSNKYFGYSFTTQSSLSNSHILYGVALSTLGPNNIWNHSGKYKVHIRIDDNAAFASPVIVKNLIQIDEDNPTTGGDVSEGPLYGSDFYISHYDFDTPANLEANKTYYLRFYVYDDAKAGVANSTPGRIIFDDLLLKTLDCGAAPPTLLSISDAVVTEGNSGLSYLNFSVQLSAAAPAGGVSFNYATADGTATLANNDYQSKTGTLTIPMGANGSVISVPVVGDTNVEPNEKIRLNITNVVNAQYINGTYPEPPQGSIINDDAAVACDASSGHFGGIVFQDYNQNGTHESGEIGLAGIIVNAYNSSNAVAATATTDAGGWYKLTGLTNGTRYRLEFTGMPSGTELGAAGSASATNVQFVTVSSTCNANLGVYNPVDYCQADPKLLTARYINGDTSVSSAGMAGTFGALLSYQYSASGIAATLNQDALASQVGSVWGLAYNRHTKKAFASAMIRRHVGLGPLGIGGLYVINYSGASPVVSSFLNLDGLAGIDVGSIGSNSARNLPGDPYLPNHDPSAFDKTGKEGLGDVELSDDGNTLYVTNLYSRKIIKVDLTTYNTSGTVPTTATEISLPNVSCTKGVARPFALKYYRGKLHAGITCTGENGGSSADLKASIQAYDGTSWVEKLQVPLNYQTWHADHARASEYSRSNIPWVSSMSQLTLGDHGSIDWADDSQLLLSGIEFDSNGDMLLGFIDRTGLQFGQYNYGTDTSSTRFYGVFSNGELLKAGYNASTGVYTLENAGSVNGIAGEGVKTGTDPAWPYGGPGGGEFYGGERFAGHTENSFGALAVIPGKQEVALNAMNPFNLTSGGTLWLDNNTGSRTRGVQLYGEDNRFLGKAVGLGDIEVLCDPAPTEIGNRVWLDSDSDGLQGAGEAGINNVTVTLTCGTDTATATTNAQGEYYFSNKAGGNATFMGNGESCSLSINNTQASLSTHALTTQNAGGRSDNDRFADIRDSDAAVNGSNAVINFTVGSSGQNNHGLDFGYKPSNSGSTCDGRSYGIYFNAANNYSAIYEMTDVGTTNGSLGTSLLKNNAFPFKSISLTKGLDNKLYSVHSNALTSGQTVPLYVYDPSTPTVQATNTGISLPYPGKNLWWISGGLDPAGNLYFMLKDGSYLVKINLATSQVTTVWSTWPATTTKAPGDESFGQLSVNVPSNYTLFYDITFDSNGDALITDADGHYVWKITNIGSTPTAAYLGSLNGMTSISDPQWINDGGTILLFGSDANTPDGTHYIDTTTWNTTKIGTTSFYDMASCDFSILPPPSTISGTVYTDSNGNDTFDSASETGISSITVTLKNHSTGTPIATTVTANNGTYSFTNLDPALTYQIEVDITDAELSGKTIGTTNPLTNKTVTAGSALANQNFGFDIVTTSKNVSGKVFEDVNYGGGAGRAFGTAGTAGVNGSKVELYSSTGAFVTSTTTAADGSYSFSSLAAGNYYVRVVSSTVKSTRAGSNGTERGIQTYRTDGTTAITGEVGGRKPAVVDAAANNTNQTLNTTTFVLSGGGQAQSVQAIALSNSSVTAADFGFNFSTIVNANDSGQGSLRQFILNSNLLGGEATLAQIGRTAGKENAIFELPTSDPKFNAANQYWSIAVATAMPEIGDNVIIDASTQPARAGFAFANRPVIELDGTIVKNLNQWHNGLILAGTNGGSTIKYLAINRFQGAGIKIRSSKNNTVSFNTIGTDPLHSATTIGNQIGIEIVSAADFSFISDNVIAHNNWHGVHAWNFNGGGTAKAAIISRNSTYANGGLGISLEAGDTNGGITVNDANDADNGANSLLNFPILSQVTSTGGNLTLTGCAPAGATVELFEADVSPSGAATVGSNKFGKSKDYGEGQTYLASFIEGSASDTDSSNCALATDADGNNQTGMKAFSVTLPTPIDFVANDTMTATATLASVGTSEFSPVITHTASTLGISGKIFEDVNYGGGAGRNATATGAAGVNGARVELYNATGTYVSNATTAADGTYSFASLANGNYFVRVVNSTVKSSRAGSNGTELGIQTYRTDGTTANANEVGGRKPAVLDSAANTTNQTLDTTTFVLSGGGQAQSVQPVTLAGSAVSGVNVGFNFSTVVNTNDSGQGSLRQGIININLLANTGLAQAGQDNTYGINPSVIKEVLLFNIPAASDPLGRTDICGGAICKITLNTQLPAVARQPAIIDATTQPGYVAGTPGVPRIHIVPATGLDARGFTMGYDAPDSTLRGFAITGFRNLLTNRGLTVDSERTIIESNYIGVKPDGTADGNGNGIELQYTQSAVIGGTTAAKRNIISANKSLGIFFNTGASGSTIQNNFIGTNPAGTMAMGNETTGIDTESGSGTKILDNVIAGNPYQGIELGFTSGGPGTANAIIQGNRIGVGINGEAIGNGTGIINYGVSNGHTIGGTGAGQANIIAHNLSGGISFYNNSSSGITISANSIYANGGLGIDLGFNGITVNDANDADAGANNLLNFPLLSNISMSGSNLVIKGCAPAGATVELFEADVSAGGGATPGANKFGKSKDYGEGQTYLTSFVEGSAADTDAANCTLPTDTDGNNQTGMKAFSVTIPTPPGFVVGDTMTATATISTSGTSEFSPTILLLEVRDIAGKVYEDVNYGGGTGRAFNAAQNMAGISAATVELRDTSNNLLASTTTAADGSYTFTSVPVGTYSVQVVNSSVRSTRPGSNGSERGVITYRTDGAGNTINVAGTTFSQTITLSTTNLSNVNFGFNFDTVTNTNDSGAGSLRQFLINANLLGGDATLAQIGRTAGKENAILELSSSDPNYTTGYWSIPLQSALPSITAPIVLDASLPVGSNSNPILELKGTNAGSGANGLTLGTGSNASTIRKLAITGFAGSGIYIDSSNNNTLLANHIGVTPSGITRANTGSGIRINAASSNNIGGINDGEGNLITNNGGSGISITNSGSMFNSILGNSIYANAGLGIDLVGGTENSFGVTANDTGDTDSGPNSLINYPEVKVNSFGANGTKIVTHDFNLDLAAGDYRLEFFVSTAKDASGNGEGQTFIGSKDLNHPGTGNLNFKGTLNAKIAVAKGAYISATLTQKTDPTTYGSTSEFSGIRDGITTQVCDSLIDDTTSGSNMVIDETDLTTVIKLLEAKDSNGNPITYVISGGTDGKFFTITNPAPGATLDCATVKFLVSNIIITKSALADNEAETRAIVTPGVLPLPGNYELPMDKDKDNVYDLQITATTVDGKKYVRDMNVRVMDTNEAPNITSATALTLTEDSNAEVLSVKAQDPDANDKLSYRISGGADSSHFEINATTGLLRFRAIPDYDAPMDTNRDNLYEVEVTVTDKGGLTNSKLFKISIVNNTADDGVVVNVRALLQGAYDSNTALMSAELNTLGLLPNKQPYQYAPFNHAGTETLSTMLKETTGNNAVVDWALVDLRTSVNTIVASRAVMLQRDGDLVDSQTGSANLHFANIKAGNYYISVRHRNHLGVMSASPVSLDNNAKLINFAASSTAVRGEETRALNGKVALMWAGDINGSNTLTANGPGNDVTSLLSGVITSTDNLQGNTNHILSGYLATDLNFDGKTLFTGPGNDTSLLVGNILLHPLNTGFAANYIVRGGLQ